MRRGGPLFHAARLSSEWVILEWAKTPSYTMGSVFNYLLLVHYYVFYHQRRRALRRAMNELSQKESYSMATYDNIII